jgi:uncharacterized protein YcaQ
MTSELIKQELMFEVKRHDYSYMMSDSHSVWEHGMRQEKLIEAKVHALCAIHREDAEGLMNEILDRVPEQYVDGLTHKVIRGWFRNYIGK